MPFSYVESLSCPKCQKKYDASKARGTATFAAVRQLKASGWLKGTEHIVCLNTGQGIKYPESVEEHVKVLQPSDRISFIR
ncbi:hypothetical protein [Priestia flexa]|uniref:Uncharacterized protein n=1 Tax=Priestia flexa TaxID=86664 RepID=A0ABU4JAQ5_9BACI|nr:hypothetical protein [Priestia flexa]MCA1203812.1 hypothetical protein [Priestia flexa]MDW8518087.1 hypothetical protein [Priestia flexa]MEC0667247.1 hypothetical protein [Priestia flexa]MED3826145.1 hypothetical protein [Priestia flexa]QCS52766.1 hypothetical protein FED53_09120 [Priestia flexa]